MGLTNKIQRWCRQPDSNRHSFRYQLLGLACLPVPPRRRIQVVRRPPILQWRDIGDSSEMPVRPTHMGSVQRASEYGAEDDRHSIERASIRFRGIQSERGPHAFTCFTNIPRQPRGSHPLQAHRRVRGANVYARVRALEHVQFVKQRPVRASAQGSIRMRVRIRIEGLTSRTGHCWDCCRR